MTEAQFQSVLTAHLSSRHGCICDKIVGVLFQAGLPDWLIAWPGYGFVLIETKVMSQKQPNLRQLISLLRPLQKKRLCQWREKNMPAFIAAWTPAGYVFTKHLPRLLEEPAETPLITYRTIEEMCEALVRDLPRLEY